MIVTVTPDPALTHTWTVAHLTPGQRHAHAHGSTRAGGRGVDVSRILHMHGRDTVAITTAGGDSGAMFSADLAGSGVPNRIVPVKHPTRRALGLVATDEPRTTLIDENSGKLTDNEADAVVEATLRIPDARLVAICGSLPYGFGVPRLIELVAMLKAQGSLVLVDTGGTALMAAARAGADVITPNAEELTVATGLEETREAARLLVDAGARVAAVTDVDDTLDVTTADASERALLPQPVRCDSVPGANAAWVATLIDRLLRGSEDPAPAFRLARRALSLAHSTQASEPAPIPAEAQGVASLAAINHATRRSATRRPPTPDQVIIHHSA